MMDMLRRFLVWLRTPIYPTHPVYPLWLVFDMILFSLGVCMVLYSVGVLLNG